MKIPDWLYLWVSKALLGEIYQSIRAIAISFDDNRLLVVRYYIDREAEDCDWENIGEVITNILSNTSSNDEILSVRDEICFDQGFLKDLDPLDGFVYARKER